MPDETGRSDLTTVAATIAPPRRPGLFGSIAHRLAGDAAELPIEGQLASFDRATGWLNSEPLTPEGLRGRVVLVDFWTYTCVNWLRTLPYVRAWDARYRGQGLTVVGVHTPEFEFEHNVDNVDRAVARLWRRVSDRGRQRLRGLAGVRQSLLAGDLPRRCAGTDPVPPLRRGRIRHDGDGDPATAAGGRAPPMSIRVSCRSTLAASRSPPTIGVCAPPRRTSATVRRPASPRPMASARTRRTTTPRPRRWASTTGRRPERGRSPTARPCWPSPADAIAFRFQARDVNLVMGPAQGRDGHPLPRAPGRPTSRRRSRIRR